MALFKFIDVGGAKQTFEAESPELAIENAPNIAPTSGVALVQEEPLVLSSEGGLDTTVQNQRRLSTFEQSLEGQDGQFVNFTGSPATQAMINEVNKAGEDGISDFTLSPQLTTTQSDILSSISAAREAQDEGDFQSLDFQITRANQLSKTFQSQLTGFFKRTGELREERRRLSIPGERETEIRRQLNDLRSVQEQFELGLSRDKLAEFEGQTLGFARGRAAELDFKASFIRQEQALKQFNLLRELGLEQELRGFELQSVEQQLSDFASDFNLRQKVQDRITTLEDDVITRADKLDARARDDLSTMIDLLDGINPTEMSPETSAKLQQLANSLDIPFDLITDALRVSYQDKILKDSQEDEVSFTDTQIAKGATAAGVSIEEFKTFSVDDQNDFINAGKIGESRLKSDIEQFLREATNAGADESETIDDIRSLIVASGYDPDTFDGGKYKKEEGGGFFRNLFEAAKSQIGVGSPTGFKFNLFK